MKLEELSKEKDAIIVKSNQTSIRTLGHTSDCICADCKLSLELARKLTEINTKIRKAKRDKEDGKTSKMSEPTIENYHKLVKKGLTQVEIAKYFNLQINKYYDWKREVGLMPSKEVEKSAKKTSVVSPSVKRLLEIRDEDNRPASSHYHTNNNGNDVWQFADDNLSDERVKGFHQINAIKYVARYEKKHDTAEKRIEDLKKAKVSIDKLIELEGME